MSPSIDQPIFTYIYFASILLIRYIIIALGTHIILWKFLIKNLLKYKLVQTPLPKGQIKREINYSIQTILIFAIGGVTNFYISQKNLGLYYKNIADYGWVYWWFSIFMMIFN
ncbi:MAG: hypothetical protein IPM57_12340 [Oligoflexia bacterium]|nr:hypothetical protein [Oligoflexia bacterium]